MGKPTDNLYVDKIRQARRMTPEQRVKAGVELFEAWRQLVGSAVRQSKPCATDDDVRSEVERRLAIQRRLDERDARGEPIYFPVERES